MSDLLEKYRAEVGAMGPYQGRILTRNELEMFVDALTDLRAALAAERAKRAEAEAGAERWRKNHDLATFGPEGQFKLAAQRDRARAWAKAWKKAAKLWWGLGTKYRAARKERDAAIERAEKAESQLGQEQAEWERACVVRALSARAEALEECAKWFDAQPFDEWAPETIAERIRTIGQGPATSHRYAACPQAWREHLPCKCAELDEITTRFCGPFRALTKPQGGEGQ
jgi:hypothetical protein